MCVLPCLVVMCCCGVRILILQSQLDSPVSQRLWNRRILIRCSEITKITKRLLSGIHCWSSATDPEYCYQSRVTGTLCLVYRSCQTLLTDEARQGKTIPITKLHALLLYKQRTTWPVIIEPSHFFLHRTHYLAPRLRTRDFLSPHVIICNSWNALVGVVYVSALMPNR
jgi:hypothetical protein